MTTRGLRSPKAVLLALLLALIAVGTGWLAFRTAAVRVLPRGAAPGAFGADDPRVVLDRQLAALIANRGILSPAGLQAVRAAARHRPLDARPYLILGHQSLLDRQDARALARLEAGQRLDPRQRVIHVLLLDRYLRLGRSADAAGQFAVLARLVGPAQGPIAGALAQMIIAPETRDAARRTLHADPVLELSVLATLARSGTEPRLVLSLASPQARAVAMGPGGWGRALVERMVEAGSYAAARQVWQRLHGIDEAMLRQPLYDAALSGSPGTPPFNWQLTSDATGAADQRAGTLVIDFYGRQSGELASQLIVLAPGTYRFSFDVGGAASGGGAALHWSVTCAGKGGRRLADNALPLGKAVTRRVGFRFTVPPGCPAQRLVLAGEAAEFPTPVGVTLGKLELRPEGTASR